MNAITPSTRPPPPRPRGSTSRCEQYGRLAFVCRLFAWLLAQRELVVDPAADARPVWHGRTLPRNVLTEDEYVIDGENRRVGRKVNGALLQGFLYADQLRIVAELDGTNNIVGRFVYGTRENVPDLMIRGGVTYRMIPDQLGSVRLVVDTATGTIAQQIEYDEFGNVASDTNPGFQPFGFAGGLYDRDTKLVRFWGQRLRHRDGTMDGQRTASLRRW